MKRIAFLIVIVLISLQSFAQFDNWFENKSLRMDYYHSGDRNTESFTFDELIEEPFWGGSKINLIDDFNYGKYYVKVFDQTINELIYSRGYSTLFGEWQTTDESLQTQRTLSESVVIPYPKNNARIEIYSRDKKGILIKKWEYALDVSSYFIKKENRLAYPSFDVLINGDAANKVDILILPDGYTNEEMGKFIADCEAFKNSLFKFSPYNKNHDKFNIRGILAPSPESGSDIPADGQWRKTLLRLNKKLPDCK